MIEELFQHKGVCYVGVGKLDGCWTVTIGGRTLGNTASVAHYHVGSVGDNCTNVMTECLAVFKDKQSGLWFDRKRKENQPVKPELNADPNDLLKLIGL